MSSRECELSDNPVLNLLRVNKWLRDNISRLALMSKTVPQWVELIEEGSGVSVPPDVVENILEGNMLTIIKTKREDR